jgi:hypothetical protein
MVLTNCLVVIHDLHFVSICSLPNEADSVLIVDANAMLPLAIPVKSLKAIARRHPQDLQTNSRIQDEELPGRSRAKIRRESAAFACPKEQLRIRVLKALNHEQSITKHII